jgi:hypothetical protein
VKHEPATATEPPAIDHTPERLRKIAREIVAVSFDVDKRPGPRARNRLVALADEILAVAAAAS